MRSNQIYSLEFLALTVSVPIIQILEFFLFKKGNVDVDNMYDKSIIPTFYLATFIYIIIRSRFSVTQLILLIYFVGYVLFFEENSVKSNSSYMISFILCCSLFFYMSEIKNIIFKNVHKIILIIFSMVFCFLYYLFAVEKFVEDRFYLFSFTTPHQFSYYCAIITYLLLNDNKTFLAIIISIAGIYVGVRSSLLVILLCYFYYFHKTFEGKLTKKKFQKVFLFLALFIPSFLLFTQIDNNVIIKITQLMSKTFMSQPGQSTSDYTSTRSILWNNMLVKVYNDGIDYNNIFGRGPRSSYAFNLRTNGTSIWMHNDFLEIFFSLGLVGVLVYLTSIYTYYKGTKNIYSLVFFLILIITNGFYTYIPIAMIFIDKLIHLKDKSMIKKCHMTQYSLL